MAATDVPAEISFGKRIQALRKQKRMTQRRVADKLGIDFTYLSKLENSRGEPPGDETIRRLAELLNGDVEELFALAGKVSREVRERASEDRNFAMLLRRLPRLSDEELRKLYKQTGVIPRKGR